MMNTSGNKPLSEALSQQLASILDKHPTATLICDQQAHIHLSNKQAEKLLACHASLLQNQSLFTVFFFYRENNLQDLIKNQDENEPIIAYPKTQGSNKQAHSIQLKPFTLDGDNTSSKFFIVTFNLITARAQESQLQKDIGLVEKELTTIRRASLSLIQDALRKKNQAEKNLHALNESHLELYKFQRAVEQSRASVIITDTKAAIEYSNNFASRTSGYSANELQGKDIYELFADQKQRQAFHYIWQQVIHGIPWEGEISSKHKNGNIKWELASISPLRDENAVITHIVIVKEDITKQRELREELIKAKEVAEAANKAKSAFLAMMSHEIRTPMNGVIGMLDILGQTSLSNDQEHYCSVAKNSAEYLLRIINDILDFSKISASKMTLEKIPTSLEELSQEVIELINSQIQSKHLQLSLLIDLDPNTWILCDPSRLRQILFNLLGNAIKFTQNNEDRQGRIIVEIKPGSSKACFVINIKDNGIGMSEEQQALLFQPFQQAEDSTHRRYGGTGLGLSICEGLVKLMHGKIQCHSVLNQGTCFSIELPYHPCPAPKDASLLPDISNLSLIIYSDQDLRRDYLKQSLQFSNSQILIANHVNDIPAMLSTNSDNIILLDVNKDEDAERSYLTLKEKIKQQQIKKLLKFIVLSDKSFSSLNKNDSLHVEYNPFIPQVIHKAIAMVSGRISTAYDKNISAQNPYLWQDTAKQTTEKHPIQSDPLKVDAANILVAEDNGINQEVIAHQLSQIGLHADMAENGQVALNMVKKKHYDLLLTDLHMPLMNGLELAQAIRLHEQTGQHYLPIIAISANTLNEELEKCLAAGMDDCLSKPLQADKLRHIILKYIGNSVQALEDLPTNNRRSNDLNKSEQNSPIDFNCLSTYIGRDHAVQEKFIHLFIKQGTSLIKDINRACEESNTTNISDIAHKFKSSARSLGANQLADICFDIEQAAKDENLEECLKLKVKLLAEFILVEKSLKLFLSN